MKVKNIKVTLNFQFLDGKLVNVTATDGYKGVDYADELKDVTLKDILKDFK